MYNSNFRNISYNELRRYVDVYYQQVNEDWYNNKTSSRRVEMKFCTQDYFGYDE